ncbi:MAG: hypothetical protein ABUK01_18655 [Leptospirales bacterium]
MDDQSVNIDIGSIIKQKRVNRRLLRKLTSKCRYCTGYEEKIVKKDTTDVSKEVTEMDKHEVVVKLASLLGNEPEALSHAESIFDEVKYSITEFVLKHEFNEESSLSVQVALWLEKRREPGLYKPLESVINKYLRPGGVS